MRAGLFRLGQDFGNGQQDQRFFQRDTLFAEYTQEKARILAEHPARLTQERDEGSEAFLSHAYDWMRAQILREQDGCLSPEEHAFLQSRSLCADWRGLSLCMQEDFALLLRDPSGDERLVLLSVCFPSGWRPEHLLGANFSKIHAPVPEFEQLAEKSSQLVRGMVDRGPYVRFVWSVTSDGRLDHHPTEAPRDPWTIGSGGYLRVERQITVPFTELHGSLFLIRTYLYPFSELSKKKRSTLREALVQMPESILEYKGLLRDFSTVLSELDAAELD